jgi:hypothetical protein
MGFRTWLESSVLEALVSGLVAKHPGLRLDAYESKEKIELVGIEVPEGSRGMGVGTEVIRSLQDYARGVGKPIVLRPEADRGRKGDLDRFYRGLGFVHNRGRNTDFVLSSPTSRTMYWRPRVDEGVRVTDRWPLNKATYDMDTPKGRRQYEIDLEELLGRMAGPSKKVVSERLVREPYTITCWRGFDMRSFERDVMEEGGRMFIGGSKAMEGMLWFTHSLQPLHDFDPRDYAVGHAHGDGYLLTYPLMCERRYKSIKYDDGSSEAEAPDESVNQTELSGKGLLWGKLYDLPHGWHFTWQVQKHIGFKGRLEIDRGMLERITT